MTQCGFERLLQVQQQRPGGGEARLVVVEAEAGQRADAEVVAQRRPRGGRVEGPVGPGGDRSGLPSASRRPFDQAARPRRWRPSRRRGSPTGARRVELVGEAIAWHVGGLEQPGGQFDPGQADRLPRPSRRGEGDEVVGLPRIEQAVVGERAGRDDAGDLAADEPALGLGGVLDLIADGDAMAGLEELAEVVFEGVVREARPSATCSSRLVRAMPRTREAISASS